jgi:hypothetical protein
MIGRSGLQTLFVVDRTCPGGDGIMFDHSRHFVPGCLHFVPSGDNIRLSNRPSRPWDTFRMSLNLCAFA